MNILGKLFDPFDEIESLFYIYEIERGIDYKTNMFVENTLDDGIDLVLRRIHNISQDLKK